MNTRNLLIYTHVKYIAHNELDKGYEIGASAASGIKALACYKCSVQNSYFIYLFIFIFDHACENAWKHAKAYQKRIDVSCYRVTILSDTEKQYKAQAKIMCSFVLNKFIISMLLFSIEDKKCI